MQLRLRHSSATTIAFLSCLMYLAPGPVAAISPDVAGGEKLTKEATKLLQTKQYQDAESKLWQAIYASQTDQPMRSLLVKAYTDQGQASKARCVKTMNTSLLICLSFGSDVVDPLGNYYASVGYDKDKSLTCSIMRDEIRFAPIVIDRSAPDYKAKVAWFERVKNKRGFAMLTEKQFAEFERTK